MVKSSRCAWLALMRHLSDLSVALARRARIRVSERADVGCTRKPTHCQIVEGYTQGPTCKNKKMADASRFVFGSLMLPTGSVTGLNSNVCIFKFRDAFAWKKMM